MQAPIYTERTVCQDCYKCLRHCPVKAIEVKDSSAVVNHTLCIFCGKCISVCPVHAKKVRTDTERARQLLSLNDRVILSIAPSWQAEFDCSAQEMIRRCRALGFYGVSETALGAETVTRRQIEDDKNGGLSISSACPTVVELISKYAPSLLPALSGIASPLMEHAQMLRELYGADTRIVFAGPCVSKKLEADDPGTAVDISLTFRELREWFEHCPETAPSDSETDRFIPFDAARSALFPVEGGMIDLMQEFKSPREGLSLSGIDSVMEALHDPELEKMDIFLELLSCRGGCINGPGCSSGTGIIRRERQIRQNAAARILQRKELTDIQSAAALPAPDRKAAQKNDFPEEEITAILRTIGKRNREDEKNCSGCGYNSCRDFARAVLAGKGEVNMCVTYMRQRAERKSDALLKTMPLAVVMMDRARRITECNAKFLETFTDMDFAPDERAIHNAAQLPVSNFIGDDSFLQRFIESDTAAQERKTRTAGRIFRTLLFSAGGQYGAIFQDITTPAVKAETVVRKTEEVIRKNLNSVQKIASLLGENAAETQLILNSVIDVFEVPRNSTGEEE
ncbi:MAG: [Fe-Fe] hydrogenase large subunit C-terminal domain-containing protein [Fibrobacterota bacterium]